MLQRVVSRLCCFVYHFRKFRQKLNKVLQYSINFRQKYLSKCDDLKQLALHSLEHSDADLTSTRRACRQKSNSDFVHIQHLAEPSKSTLAGSGVLILKCPQNRPAPAARPQYDQSTHSEHNASLSFVQAWEPGSWARFQVCTVGTPLGRFFKNRCCVPALRAGTAGECL